jgi:hypothetical protein
VELNNDRLSEHERAQMRELVTSGARRMRDKQGRWTKATAVAAAFLLVLTVIAGVSVAALRPLDHVAQPVETTASHSPSATPTPTPTPTPAQTTVSPSAPAAAVIPFGGDCANVLSVDDVGAWLGTPVHEPEQLWVSPQTPMSGGLTCLWVATGAYQWGYLEVTVFPLSLFEPTDTAPVSPAQCESVTCHAAARIDGTWAAFKYVGNTAPDSEITLRRVGGAELEEVISIVRSHSAGYAPPRPAERGTSWWPGSGCEIVAGAMPAGVQFLTGLESSRDFIKYPGAVIGLAELGVDVCYWEDPTYGRLILEIIPGGGAFYDAVAELPDAKPVAVPGSDGAIYVPNDYVWDYNGEDLIVRSGANLVIVGGSGGVDPDAKIPTLVAAAEAALAALNATLG